MILEVERSDDERIEKLANASYQKYIDLEKSLDWSQGVNRAVLPKTERSSWVYGTPYWERLNGVQRMELLWQEIAREVSLFIMLEQVLPPMYVNYVNRFASEMSSPVRDYMLVFSKEELVHIMMFRRYLRVAGLEQFPVPPGYHEFYVDTLPNMPPIYGVFATLLLENIAEYGVMFSTQADEVDPLTRAMFRAHHAEELRHLSFGKWVVESHLQRSGREERQKFIGFGKSILQRSLPPYVFNGEIQNRLSFDLGPSSAEEIELVRRSDNNRQINAERFGAFFDWLDHIGIDAREVVAA